MNILPTEHEECMILVDFLDLMGLKYTHIPNETFTKSWNQKRKNKQAGVKKGFPDYCIIHQKGLVFLEMKRQKGGVVSPEQKDWLDCLNQCKGVSVAICKGSEEAIKFLQSL